MARETPLHDAARVHAAVEHAAAAADVAPHARATHERARKLLDLAFADLTVRVAEGLARRRAALELDPPDADPLRALCAAFPRTAVARRAEVLAAEVDAERARALEAQRAAADVERRSESLKDALRERSADLAAAIARVDAAAGTQRELESARARIGALEQELARLAQECGAAADALEQSSLDREVLLRQRDGLRAALDAGLARERAALDLAGLEKAALFGRADALRDDLALATRDAVERERARRDLESALARAAEREAAARADLGRELDSLRAAQERDIGASRAALAESEREIAWRRAEMTAVADLARGITWKLLGGSAAARIAAWERGAPR